MARPLVVVLLTVLPALVAGFSCVCSPSECEDLSESDCPGGGTVWDPCGCCRVCARVENEPCGGPYGFHGSCARGLECVVAAPATGKPVLAANSEGICSRIPGSDVRCPDPEVTSGCNMVGHHCKCSEVPVCPGDSPFSFATHAECEMNLAVMLAHEQSDDPQQGAGWNCTGGSCTEEDEAQCPPDSLPDLSSDPVTCVCQTDQCPSAVCHFRPHRRLLRRGTGVPGDCCDKYECVPTQEKNCTGVVCAGQQCPEDSYRLPSHPPVPGNCCSVPGECVCNPVSNCVIPSCSPDQEARVVQPGGGGPGSCCALYECVSTGSNESCEVDGRSMSHGDSWWKSGSDSGVRSCSQCSCVDGKVECDDEAKCPELPANCYRQHFPPNQCCPVCIAEESMGESIPSGCVLLGGRIVQNGHTWNDNPCTTCVCEAGKKSCQQPMCKNCGNPTHVPDECCPVCNTTSIEVLPSHCTAHINCSLKCVNGLIKDNTGCYNCQCKPDPILEKCVRPCPHGYLKDSFGNQLCECASPPDCPTLIDCSLNCSHGYRLNKGGCETCKCNKCRPMHDCNKKCEHGLSTNDRGCTICKCQGPPEPRVTTPVAIAAQSCVSADGLMHVDGETWQDGCRECYCHEGQEMCSLLSCPSVSCSIPVYNSSTDCCPHCPSDVAPPRYDAMMCHSSDGRPRVEGSTWHLDGCTLCMCHHGLVLCGHADCPPTPCWNPVRRRGSCCPRCPRLQPLSAAPTVRGCEMGSHVVTWSDGGCRTCVCNQGRESCFTEECFKTPCLRPVLVKDHCCPLCLDALPMCVVGNITYLEGETWNENSCTHCTCEHGAKSCTHKTCNAACPNPIIKPGQCCSICPDAEGLLVKEMVYIAAITVLCVVCVLMACYLWLQCCLRRRQMRCQDTPQSLNNPAYHGFPPPHYSSTERKPKCDDYRYRYVPTYESLKSPTTEKSALAPV